MSRHAVVFKIPHMSRRSYMTESPFKPSRRGFLTLAAGAGALAAAGTAERAQAQTATKAK
ncbi:MAG: twin-arginine translocation signal domain-containing protein, partial [Mameliella sp.]|nr:twin-arginine translocation signal domain-containing protein [Mameliella sp.]